jgi:hypothetical protein
MSILGFRLLLMGLGCWVGTFWSAAMRLCFADSVRLLAGLGLRRLLRLRPFFLSSSFCLLFSPVRSSASFDAQQHLVYTWTGRLRGLRYISRTKGAASRAVEDFFLRLSGSLYFACFELARVIDSDLSFLFFSRSGSSRKTFSSSHGRSWERGMDGRWDGRAERKGLLRVWDSSLSGFFLLYHFVWSRGRPRD